jgi:hypothetical protein
MMKPNKDKIRSTVIPNFSDDSVRIEAGSFVFDNKWINFNGSIFKVKDYITSSLVGSRTRFFKDRNYAVYILVGLDPTQGVRVAEGIHVPFSTIGAVPPPTDFDFLPLVGIIAIQDGTRDLNYGYKPIEQQNVILYSGYGNITDKDLVGIPGVDSVTIGDTGFQGYTGIVGTLGEQGRRGMTGQKGPTPIAPAGVTGIGGMTGISWSIHIPFNEFF